MFKLIYCIARKPGLTREDFLRTWLEDHAPLVKFYAEAIGAVRYVQSHTRIDDINAFFSASRGLLEQPYDGVTETWWRSHAEFIAAAVTTAGKEAAKALLEDEKRFIDFQRSCIFVTDEHGIFDSSH